jgi:hypothetical protein
VLALEVTAVVLRWDGRTRGPDEHGAYEQWAGDTCFGIWEPEKVRMPFVAQKGNP